MRKAFGRKYPRTLAREISIWKSIRYPYVNVHQCCGE